LDNLERGGESDHTIVTFLSILAHDAIALPLSQGFPVNELRYILENSQAKIFLSTTKFQDKANEVLAEGLEHKPILKVSEKIETGAESAEKIKLEAMTENKGGFMLYTSGTTNRPVRKLPQGADE
jgi:acyl-coenzyme A synthetase/AMP-(fatty) acid ligase